MRKTWPEYVYTAAAAVGFVAGFGIVAWLVGPEMWGLTGDLFVVAGIAGAILAIIATALIDFTVHGWWKRPPPDPDPWAEPD